jgi:hypothetical protein
LQYAKDYTLPVEITLVRVEITLVRFEITLLRVLISEHFFLFCVFGGGIITPITPITDHN